MVSRGKKRVLCKQIGEKSSQNAIFCVGVLVVLLLLLFMRKKLEARESASEFHRVGVGFPE